MHFKDVNDNKRNIANKVQSDFLKQLSAQGSENMNWNEWTNPKDAILNEKLQVIKSLTTTRNFPYIEMQNSSN